MPGWRPINDAWHITLGTVADLRMESGRIYRATWCYRGRVCAWWPDSSVRKKPIGLYALEAFKVIAVGVVPDRYNSRRHAVGF